MLRLPLFVRESARSYVRTIHTIRPTCTIHTLHTIRPTCTTRYTAALQRYSRLARQSVRGYFRPARYTTELSTHLHSQGGIPIYRIVDEQGELLDRKLDPKLSRETARKMMRDMLVLGSLDQILYDAQRQGRVSFYMTNTGEEATHIGSAAALQPDDPVFGQYRELGVLIWRGFTIADVMNQCYSNHLDVGKGRQMPVHYGSAKLHFQTISSPLGTQLPQAAGAAYSLKTQGQRRVVMCYFGEGAASEGDFHAALNIAATTESPVIFFCRNNHYAISTSLEEQYRGDGIASRGPGYGVPSIRVDGNDLLAVYSATAYARKLALEKSTPVLIEAITYRVGHHSTSDDSLAYRGKAEIDQWTSGNNPVARFQKYLIQRQLWTEEEEKKLREDIRKETLAEFAAAEARPKPAIQEMFTDVYDELPWHLAEQQDELRALLRENPEKYPIDRHVESAAFLK